MGLRKALEFLIKDYICYKNPEKEIEIKKLFLGNCISIYIDNSRLKNISERAVWLGNDETHYIRKWKNQDIKDLKNLINITVSWIDTELLADKYEKEMPKKS